MPTTDHGPRWLGPGQGTIEDEGDGLLRVAASGRLWPDVFAVKAFPAAAEERYISLRHREPSGREHELGMIRSLVAWPRSARAAVGRSLGRRYLFHAIDAVRQIRSDENRVDLLVVAGGVRTRVQVDNRGDNFHRFGLNGLLLLDVKGSYYVIADRAALPKRQRNLLELYFGD